MWLLELREWTMWLMELGILVYVVKEYYYDKSKDDSRKKKKTTKVSKITKNVDGSSVTEERTEEEVNHNDEQTPKH